MSVLLEARNVVKAYGHTPVLRGIDLSIDEGQVVALVGASGSGKSTLLRCLSLLEPVSDGQVFLDGEDITDPSARTDRVRSKFGVVFQAFNLFPHLTVMQNITLAPRRVHGRSRVQAEARGRELLERIGLGGRGSDYPDRLSGGQQQRVAIVRAIAVEPRVLILDEVTSALDPTLVAGVLALVRELAGQGRTIVMATHDRSRVDRLLGRNIAIAVVRQTELPVLVIRPTDAWTSRTTAFKRLLVCLDGSEGSEEVLPWTRLLGRHFGSSIVLLSVPEGETEVPRLEHYLDSVATALRDIGFPVETRVLGSNPVGTITAVAAEEQCDLIAMATRGRGAPRDLDIEVGSVTDRVIHSAHCPVFAVTVTGFNPDAPGNATG